MSTPVTAQQVAEQTWVMHDGHLCHVIEKHTTDTGSVFIEWTEALFGREAYFSGSFNPNAQFGEQTAI